MHYFFKCVPKCSYFKTMLYCIYVLIKQLQVIWEFTINLLREAGWWFWLILVISCFNFLSVTVVSPTYLQLQNTVRQAPIENHATTVYLSWSKIGHNLHDYNAHFLCLYDGANVKVTIRLESQSQALWRSQWDKAYHFANDIAWCLRATTPRRLLPFVSLCTQ